MNVRYLEYILEIAKQKSITRAAQRLYVTQSSLSQYLLKLEAELGTQLFIRTRNELTPTDAGEMYVQAAGAVVRIQRTLYENIAALKNEGCIRLGISSQWGVKMTANLLPAFRERFPHITLQIYENSYNRLKSMLTAGKIDMAVMAAGDPPDLSLPYHSLRREELLLAVPSKYPFCARHPTGRPVTRREMAAGLRTENFIFSDEGSTVRMAEDAMFQQMYFKPQVICELNSNLATLQMVENGTGIALIPDSYASKRQNVSFYPLEPGLFRSNILVFRKDLEEKRPERFLTGLIRGYPIFCGNS